MKARILIILAVLALFLLVFGCMEAGLVATGVGTQVMSTGSGVPESQAKATWKSAEPLGIIDWTREDGALTLVFRNNVTEIITLKEINLTTGVSSLEEYKIASAGTRTIILNGLGSCTPGSKYSISQEGIEFVYDTPNIPGKVQNALTDIVGTC